MLQKLDLSGGTGGKHGEYVYKAPNGVVVTCTSPPHPYSNWYYMENLFNGKYSTYQNDGLSYWLTTGNNATLDIDLRTISDKLLTIDHIVVCPRIRDESISDYQIFISNDGINWELIIRKVVNTYANTSYGLTRKHSIKQKANFIRFELFRKGSWGVGLSEIEIYAQIDETDLNRTGTSIPLPILGWKRIDSSHSQFKYTGSWDAPSGSDYWKNGAYRTQQIASKVSFSFYGSKLRLITLADSTTSDKIVISIDGVPYNCSSRTAFKTSFYVAFEVTNLIEKVHNVECWQEDGAPFIFDAIDMSVKGGFITNVGDPYPEPDPTWQRIEDTHSHITYLYKNQHLDMHYNAGEIRFTFEGTKLRLVYNYNWGGNGDVVFIDGIQYPTLRRAGSGLFFEKTGLSYGKHEVLIKTHTGSDWYSQFNALEIDEEGRILLQTGSRLPMPEEGWKRIESSLASFKMMGNWVFENHAAHSNRDTFYTLDGTATLTFKFTGSKIRILGYTGSGRPTDNILMLDGIEYRLDYSKPNGSGSVVLFQIENLNRDQPHEVMMRSSNPTSAPIHINLDAVDIDEDGTIIHPDEVAFIDELQVGKRIRCNYKAFPNLPGVFSNLGEHTGELLSSLPTAEADGDFYFIAVDQDINGRMIMVADRNIQAGVTWEILNDTGLMSGIMLEEMLVASTPKMSSDQAVDGSCTLSASHTAVNNEPWRAFDWQTADNAHKWQAPKPSPAWIKVSYPVPKIINRISLVGSSELASNPRDWTFEGSNDGHNWEVLDRRTSQTGLDIKSFYSFHNERAFRHYRLVITENNGHASILCKVGELQLYEAPALSGILARILTGFNPPDSEWDKYIVHKSYSTGIKKADEYTWNTRGVWSQTSSTNNTSSTTRTVRGYSSNIASISNISTVDVSLVNTGFRPVFVIEAVERENSELSVMIQVPYRSDLTGKLHVYKDQGTDAIQLTGDITLPMDNEMSHGYTVRASAVYSNSYSPWLAFNNKDSGYWTPGSTGGKGWIAIDIAMPANATGYLLGASDVNPHTDMPKSWTFEGSDDGITWTVLDAQDNAPVWGQKHEKRKYDIKSPAASFRWFRLNISSTHGGWIGIGEIEIYGFRGGLYNQRKSYIQVPYRNDLTSQINLFSHHSDGEETCKVTLEGTDSGIYLSNNYNELKIIKGTIEARIRTTDAGTGYRGIVVKQSAYGMFLYSNELVIFDWRAGNARHSGVRLNDGQEHHVAFVFESGVSKGAKLYVDGKKVMESGFTSVDQNQGLAVGDGTPPGPSHQQSFRGDIWGVKVWNKTLSESELQASMYSNYPDEPGLVLFYDMKDSNGRIAYDKTRNKYDGEIVRGSVSCWMNKGNQNRSYIEVPYHDSVTSSIFIAPHAIMKAVVGISPVYNEDFVSHIQVKNTEDMQGKIAVSSHGRMRATVEVTPPPKVVQILSSVKDAFVRDRVPRLNYGQEQEMLVGKAADGEVFKSLIQFDMSTVPADQKITKATLKLFVDQSTLGTSAIQVQELLKDWAEDGVTWASTPPAGNKLAEITADTSKSYVEVDLLSAVLGWYNNTSDNLGILLHMEQLTSDVIARFGSRERGMPYAPELVLEYHSLIISSVGHGEMKSSITSRQNKDKDIRATIHIRSTRDDSELMASLKVHNPDMILSSLSVSRASLPSKITVRKRDDSTLPASVTVQLKRDSVLDSSVIVTRDWINGTIITRQKDKIELPGTIMIRRSERNSLSSQLYVSRPDMLGHLFVYLNNDLRGFIEVAGFAHKNLSSSVTVRRMDNSEMNSQLNIWVASILEGSITIKSGYISSSIIVPHREVKDLRTSIKVSEKYAEDLFTTIIVGLYDDGSYAFIM
ncbi:DNRLRE domain-containing protein [Paenibacillus arenosi]|uniref:DNRLRE domain-containing protein n=1 Tax=Paenibacillus arenosi TaxID=2774142 RepID=A0ABR9AXL2_9BACL|nr:DNRLRE domain-containing protein [Paenibacillus arenosi]MBD8498872.1 DNRLRE domain-containing protein [Paenibacillus arenosi]